MATTIVRPRVFLDLMTGSEPAGRVVLELFSDKAPKTCENFRALCTSTHTPQGASKPLSYKLSPLHRVIDEFMIQGGDITAGDGTGGQSIYGREFEDENLGWRDVEAEGLLCMANRGKGTNSSQFFITLAPCPHLNGKHTIFGHVVSGMQHLQAIAKTRVDKNDRPLTNVLISHCGELERRTKAKPTASVATRPKRSHKNDQNDSADRGRKRTNRSVSPSRSETSRSASSSQERRQHHQSQSHAYGHSAPDSSSSSPRSPPPSKKSRRRSDLDLDETRRGRTLTRSPSPSVGKAVPRVDREDTRHKRRESPSRGQGKNGDGTLRRESREREGERKRGRWDVGRGEGGRFAGGRREDERGWGRRERNDRWKGRDDGKYGGGNRWDGEGRLGGHGEKGWDYGNASSSVTEVEVKFKGRGSMKYRENGW